MLIIQCMLMIDSYHCDSHGIFVECKYIKLVSTLRLFAHEICAPGKCTFSAFVKCTSIYTKHFPIAYLKRSWCRSRCQWATYWRRWRNRIAWEILWLTHRRCHGRIRSWKSKVVFDKWKWRPFALISHIIVGRSRWGSINTSVFEW